MNKEEGFILVELLTVIVILRVVVAIAIPTVGSVIDRAETDSNEAKATLIEDTARLYATTEKLTGEVRITKEANEPGTHMYTILNQLK
jgi:type IV pilus assembly protein PilA